MDERFGLSIVLLLLASGCGGSSPLAPTAATVPVESGSAVNVVIEPDPLQTSGLQSSTMVAMEVRTPAATGGTIDVVRFVVRDSRGAILVQTEVKGPIPVSMDGTARVSQRLSWSPVQQVGRTLEIAAVISDAQGTRTLERTLTFQASR